MGRHDISQKHCNQIVRQRAKNFALALKFLPFEKREAMHALYAFARIADDIVDGDRHDLTLPELEEQLDQVLRRPSPDGPSWHAALGRAVSRFDLPDEHFRELIKGMAMDLDHQPPQTWQDTETYCYRAASTVGLLSLEVFGYSSPKARRPARDLGMAMQLTNILRDLREDHGLGRQYLPAEDFADFGITPADLMSRHQGSAVKSFLVFQIDRARTYYQSAQRLFPYLDKDAAFCPRALSGIYGEYLDQLAKNPFVSLQGPISIPTHRKLWITVRSRFSR